MTPSERRDPDDPDSSGEPTASDVDLAFAQIISGWDEQARPRWPAEDADDDDDDAREPQQELTDDATPTEELPTAPAGQWAAVDEEDDHFTPPEPPPFPRPQPATLGAVGLFLLGVLFLAAPGVIGFSEHYGLPLGLLSITGAIVWLAARLRQGPPTDSGWDDGAQV